MLDKDKKYTGFLLTELIVAFSVLGILLVALVLLLDGFRRFNHYQLVRQHCIAAAQAQLDSIMATGNPVRDELAKQLWPKLDISLQQAPGTGQWKALKLVEVTAEGKSLNRKVKVKLCRYILLKEQQ